MKALVLDFGGPVLRTPFELLRGGERRAGLAPGSLAWSGPFDPAADAEWRRMQAGETTERAYWQDRAAEFAALTGADAGFRGLMDVLFDGEERELVRPEARLLVHAAHAAGLAVAVCTNDLQAFHSPEWVARMSVLGDVDLLVDGSVEGVLKPDPRIYALVTERLGVAAEECVFVDDQPGNVAGAVAVGMRAVLFDVTDPSRSYAEAREALGLPG
ncbi:MAG: HAD-IA family hydrolase [Frankiales bacterium]|nr:HAD-IA family hydrolase [Frankiales bacterium]